MFKSMSTLSGIAPDLAAFPIALFRRIRFRDGLFCPRCGHKRVHRWGTSGWRQRYRCLGCRRTFSDFTGTPLAYLKKVERWPRFCRLALETATIREAAERLGVHTTTSFRWRHRFLDGLRRTEPVVLKGRVSVAARWFPVSLKGARDLPRPPRRRPYIGLSSGTDAIWLVFACDEAGRSFARRTGPRSPGPVILRETLGDHLDGVTTLLAGGGHRGRVESVAVAFGIPFECEFLVDWLDGEPPPPEPALLHVVRIKRWLGRYHGVATRYLENYLVWFRWIDLPTRCREDPRRIGRELVGAFP